MKDNLDAIENYKEGDDPVEVYKSHCGEKGTGKWTAAVSDYHRNIGSTFWFLLEGLINNRVINQRRARYEGDKEEFLEHLKNALHASTLHIYCKMVDRNLTSYFLFRYNKWVPDVNRFLNIWKGTGQFRCALLSRLEQNALERIPDPDHDYPLGGFWIDDSFTEIIKNNLPAIQKIVDIGNHLNIKLYQFKSVFNDCVRRYTN